VTARVARAASLMGLRAWEKLVRRPVDSFAIFGAVAASLVIIVNAVFLQSGAHPTQFSANPSAPPRAVAEVQARPADPPVAKPAEQTASLRPTVIRAPQPVAPRRIDPIAELIEPSPRIMAVQNALSEYGYGQIKPTGFLDQTTRAAIEKFERERKLPVTGRVSDRLVSDLATLTGHPLD
jgi:Putative peptidoglycan binding domain